MREKTYSFLTDDVSEDKEAEGVKACVITGKLKVEDYENCLEAALLKNKVNHQEKSKIHKHSFKKYHKEFIKTKN